MEISPQERALLRQIQQELAKILRKNESSRTEALSSVGISEGAFDSAWSRGSIKLVWVLRLLTVHDINPKTFFDRVFGEEPLRPDTPPPKISKLAQSRLPSP